MDFDLQKYAQWILNLPCHNLSVWGLESLSRIHISLYGMIVTDALDSIYGKREKYFTRMKELYKTCSNRYKRADIIGACRLADVMQSLAYAPGVLDSQWQDTCYRQMWQFVEQKSRIVKNWDIPQWLWCVACSCYPLSDESAGEECFLRFRQQLEKWIIDWDTDGQWQNLSVCKALQRLRVLNGNSYMFLDDAYDNIICAIYHYYRMRVPLKGNIDTCIVKQAGMLYEQAGITKAYPADWDTMKAVVRFMSACLLKLRADSDEWLYALSVLIENKCQHIMKEVSRQIDSCHYVYP